MILIMSGIAVGYVSDHFRVGKYLSPHMIGRLEDRSIYTKIREHSTEDLAKEIWNIWKDGRNKVIHYYPHNINRLSYEEARFMIGDILNIMIKAYNELK